jgi:SAM-dependent methyltransferase
MGYGSYRIWSGSTQFWTSPGWTADLDRSTVEQILKQVQPLRARSLLWQVRFDHDALAGTLRSLGLNYSQLPVCVLDLDGGHERVFARYNASFREEVRCARRRGIVVRNTSDINDILAYHAIFNKFAQDERRPAFPARMTLDLVKLRDVACFMVAEYGGTTIGGLMCLRDGNTIYTLHLAYDRKYNHLFPGVALYNAAIKWACDAHACYFDFGHCGTAVPEQPLHFNQTLAEFGSAWGARIESNWVFSWESVIWKQCSKLKSELSARRKKLGFPKSVQAISNQPERRAELTWAQSAQLGELRAVCYPYGSESKNTMMHSASLFAAAKALSFANKPRLLEPTLLDFGCGTGRMVRYFAQLGWAVLGLDITYKMLEKAKYYGLPRTSQLALYDGRSFPVKGSSVDVIWSTGVLKYILFPPGSRCLGRFSVPSEKGFIPTYAEIAKEMYRVLKPGGIIAAFESHIDESFDFFLPSFLQAGFSLECIAVLRRSYDLLERLCDGRFSNRLGQWLVFRIAKLSAMARYYLDDPQRSDAFVDYLFVWRKPLDRA